MNVIVSMATAMVMAISMVMEEKMRMLKKPVEDPFRMFFPAAIAAGILGVMLWPVYLAGWTTLYPGVPHARIMVTGMLGAFALGFLCTAAPRMLEVPSVRVWEAGVLGVLWLLQTVLYTFGKTLAADAVFVLMLLALAVVFATRWSSRKDLPPPGFVVVPIAFAAAALAAVVMILLQLNPNVTHAASWRMLARFWMYQGFMLLPVLGIAPFFFGRFGGEAARHDSPESRNPTRKWVLQAMRAALTGILLLALYAAEAFGMRDWLAGSMRLVLVLAFVSQEISFSFRAGKSGSLGAWIPVGIVCMVSGVSLPSMLSSHSIAWLHLLMVGGFGLLAMCVASWVTLGHSGQITQAKGRLWTVRIGASLILLALFTRISADLFPDVRNSHLVYAALAWTLGMAIWGWLILRKLGVVSEE